MADNVNLQQSEYDPALEKMNLLHETAISTLEKLSKEVCELSQIDGGFYIENISAKIAALMDTLDSSVVGPMKTNMEAVKESMDSFAEIIINVDTACDI